MINKSSQDRSIVLSLWARAPFWRLSVLSACLLTLLFVLFPPAAFILRQNNDVPGASYTPTSKNESLAILDSSSGGAIKSPDLVAASNQPAIPKAVPLTPKTANLSLAEPNATANPKNTSDLDDALLGRLYEGSLRLNGFNLTLPSGRWAMLSNTSINTSGMSGGAYFLGRIERRRLVAALKVFVVSSKEKPGAGFDVKHCAPGNPDAIYIEAEQRKPFDSQSCWSIHNIYTTPWLQWADRATRLPSLERAAAGDLAAKGVTYSQDFVAVTFTRAEKWGLLEVTHLVSPEAEGITSSVVLSYRDSDWHRANIVRYPEKEDFVDRLKDPSETYWEKIKLTFEGGAPLLEAPPPNVSGVSSNDTDKYQSRIKQIINTSRAASESVNPVQKNMPIGARVEASPEGTSEVLDALADVAQYVKQACMAPQNRVPSISTTSGTSQVHLETSGLWCFFDAGGKLYDVRVNFPFEGSVAGIRVGDSLLKVEEVLGAPIKKSSRSNIPEIRYYRIKSSLQLQVWLTNANTVESIILTR